MENITITIKDTTLDYIKEKLLEIYDQGIENQNTGEIQVNWELKEVLEDLGLVLDE